MILGPLIMVLVLVVAGAAVVFIVRRLDGADQAFTPRPRKALDILKERFARGEIDKEEFEERRRVLNE